ncbi:hypothetical protein DEU56DRAFT_851594 [Suillus clintonianus]|uniref:uncharacterized protein n=1 Tax=Suillus clintonianus TaxID=1904413 RepID=UPI001B867A17|nr:uncharacterized protein DEU56DRAFT_851594 [Suillus clintonianus]KAG2149310.1 hypothetical protein DEU56DRAFT_851594 [Suillus clintonianus]
MHHWIPDVVQLIFEYVYDPIREEEDSEGRVTVAGLARTCRAFKDPAQDILWAQLHSLEALVLCSGGRRDANSQLIWDRPAYDADWRNLAQFGKRVRTLTIPPQSNIRDISTMQLLSCFPLPGPILPNLTRLNWLSDREDFFPFLRRFCGPNLTALSLSPISWSVRKCATVASLAPSCPLLKEFRCVDAEDSSMQAISEAVVGWNELQVLQVGLLDKHALTHAGSLSTLQELHFSVTDDIRYPMLEFCSPHASMTISTQSPSSIHAFIQNVHLSTQRLHLCCGHYDGLFPQLFFERLKSCFRNPEELLELGLVKTIRHNRSMIINSRMLHPLVSFKGLNSLNLADLCTAHIDDAFLKEMAMSCVHLQELHLGDKGRWPTAPLATFDGVVSLIKHCRQLSSLGIFFNATFESDIIDVLQTDAINLNIRNFSVGASPIDDPMKVTVVLSLLIPNAIHIDHCTREFEFLELPAMEGQWDTVNAWFKPFVSARKHSWEQGWLEGKMVVEKNE